MKSRKQLKVEIKELNKRMIKLILGLQELHLSTMEDRAELRQANQ